VDCAERVDQPHLVDRLARHVEEISVCKHYRRQSDPQAGRRTDRDGNPISDFFENNPDEATVLKSEAVAEKQLAKEEEAIDKFLDGDDSAFDDLDY